MLFSSSFVDPSLLFNQHFLIILLDFVSRPSHLCYWLFPIPFSTGFTFDCLLLLLSFFVSITQTKKPVLMCQIIPVLVRCHLKIVWNVFVERSSRHTSSYGLLRETVIRWLWLIFSETLTDHVKFFSDNILHIFQTIHVLILSNTISK